jgi:hypothetical protein
VIRLFVPAALRPDLILCAKTTAPCSFFARSLPPLSSGFTKIFPLIVKMFGNAVTVEHRYIWSILHGIQDAGLAVSRG